jgi:hypothetical protein
VAFAATESLWAALHSGDRLSLDIAAVGTANPGSDLTLIIRL